MRQALILYPLMAMAGLTFLVGLRMLRLRFRAVARGEINPRYFLLNRGGGCRTTWPGSSSTNRTCSNCRCCSTCCSWRSTRAGR